MRSSFAILLLLSYSPEQGHFLFRSRAEVGIGCTTKVESLYPRLRTCTISGEKKYCLWCPNGDVFDLDDATAPKPLARSLCGLKKIAE